jgi:hypothetical protein
MSAESVGWRGRGGAGSIEVYALVKLGRQFSKSTLVAEFLVA